MWACNSLEILLNSLPIPLPTSAWTENEHIFVIPGLKIPKLVQELVQGTSDIKNRDSRGDNAPEPIPQQKLLYATEANMHSPVSAMTLSTDLNLCWVIFITGLELKVRLAG